MPPVRRTDRFVVVGMQPEIMTPAEPVKSFNWQAFILWPLAMALLYVLSAGPVVLAVRKGKLPRQAGEIIQVIYRPVAWLYEETPLHKPLGMYLHLWCPDGFDKYGDGI